MNLSNAELFYLASQRTVKSFLIFLALANSKLLTNETPQFHKEIIEYYLNNKNCILAAPRSHSKTTLTAFYFFWQLVTQDKSFGVWISSTNTEATRVGQTLRETFYNKPFIKLFGIEVKSESVQQLEFAVRGTKKAIRFDGIMGKLRGVNYLSQRPAIVAMDDVENDTNVRSGEQRKHLRHIYDTSILSLGDAKTQYIVLGTVLHHDSLLANLLKRENTLFYATTPENPLWKDRFNSEWLLNKKEEIGSLAFAQEYENRPMLQEDAIFKEEWIKYGSSDGGRLVLSVDPAISKSETADNTGLLLISQNNGKFYIKEDFTAKYTSVELVQKILSIATRIRPEAVIIEEVAYQASIKEWLFREAKNYTPPIKAVKPLKDKVTRAIAQVPHFENGNVYFEKPFDKLRTELLQFPLGAHDDRVDALTQALNYFNTQSTVIKSHKIPKYLAKPKNIY